MTETRPPTVSIVTTVLNSKDTIESTLRSVLEQTYRNIEYIITDGGSTDGTMDIINRYRDRIAQFVSEPDKGVQDGMNKGIRLANGEIIGILNADDFYASNDAIETVANAMREKDVDVCWGDLLCVDRKNPDRIVRYWKSSEYEEGKFRNGWMPPHPTFFVRKQIYEKYGTFNLDFKFAADYELMLRFLEKYKVSSCYIPKIMVRYRLGGGSSKSIGNMVKANIECYRSWSANGLKINPIRIFLKPVSKIPQFFRR